MKRILSALLTFAAMVMASPPSQAGIDALIALSGAGDATWERRLAVQDLLRRSFGFQHVEVLVDATADELPKRVTTFLQAPEEPGDRRLVWISGFGRNGGRGICPAHNARPIRPAAPVLVMAPGCYVKAIRFPQGARHYGLTAPTPAEAAARIGRIDDTDPAWVAVLTLPDDAANHIEGADGLVFEHLKAVKTTGIIDPAQILAAVRSGFRWNGSTYTPSLDLFHSGAGTDELAPLGFRANPPRIAKRGRTRPLAGGRRHLNLHEQPTTHAGPALRLSGAGPVRVLRADKSGAMRYVSVGQSLFGWVRKNDLRL